MIPAANVKNLMLRRDVVDAVAEGQFHIYPVKTIDEGIEILTGSKAGEKGLDGHYPAESINRRVADRREKLAETQRNFQNNGQGQKQTILG